MKKLLIVKIFVMEHSQPVGWRQISCTGTLSLTLHAVRSVRCGISGRPWRVLPLQRSASEKHLQPRSPCVGPRKPSRNGDGITVSWMPPASAPSLRGETCVRLVEVAHHRNPSPRWRLLGTFYCPDIPWWLRITSKLLMRAVLAPLSERRCSSQMQT